MGHLRDLDQHSCGATKTTRVTTRFTTHKKRPGGKSCESSRLRSRYWRCLGSWKLTALAVSSAATRWPLRISIWHCPCGWFSRCSTCHFFLHMNIHSIYTQFTHTNTQHARTRTRICSRQRLRLSDEGRVKKRVKKMKHLKMKH